MDFDLFNNTSNPLSKLGLTRDKLFSVKRDIFYLETLLSYIRLFEPTILQAVTGFNDDDDKTKVDSNLLSFYSPNKLMERLSMSLDSKIFLESEEYYLSQMVKRYAKSLNISDNDASYLVNNFHYVPL